MAENLENTPAADTPDVDEDMGQKTSAYDIAAQPLPVSGKPGSQGIPAAQFRGRRLIYHPSSRQLRRSSCAWSAR